MRPHWSRIAAKPLYAPHVNTVSDRLGFCDLGCERLSVWLFSMQFSVLVEFFLRFCGCGWFFSTALRFLIDPLILPYSGVPHGFLLCKLKISLARSTDLPFCSVLRNSFNFLFFIFFLIFLEIKCCCLSHFTLEFGTENEGNAGWKLGCLCQTAWSCLCLHYHVLLF